MVERRTLLRSMGLVAALGAGVLKASPGGARAAAQEPGAGGADGNAGSGGSGGSAGSGGGSDGSGKPMRQIAMLMYPGFFAQDLVGPYTVFASLPDTQVHLIARSKEPLIATPAQFPILPSGTFEDCPRDLDVLLVPGGAMSTVQALEDEATVAFVRDRGSRAKYVTSVCTGSLILGAAGLLQGYKATSHWVTHDLLARYGAIPTKGRVVVDRNRISGGGVTAGIDFGLKVAAILESDLIAEVIQLAIEYDPEPPYDSGSPERAPANVRALAEKNYQPFRAAVQAAVERTARKLET